MRSGRAEYGQKQSCSLELSARLGATERLAINEIAKTVLKNGVIGRYHWFKPHRITLHNSIRQYCVRDLYETRDVGASGVIDVTVFLSVLHTTLVNVTHDDAKALAELLV